MSTGQFIICCLFAAIGGFVSGMVADHTRLKFPDLNAMMRPVRRLVYKVGFRPKPGSIFYSPSFISIAMGEAMGKAIHEGFARSVEVQDKLFAGMDLVDAPSYPYPDKEEAARVVFSQEFSKIMLDDEVYTLLLRCQRYPEWSEVSHAWFDDHAIGIRRAVPDVTPEQRVAMDLILVRREYDASSPKNFTWEELEPRVIRRLNIINGVAEK